MSVHHLTIDIHGHPLSLSAQRAAFDPVLKSLFVADAHFGKDAVFRAHGIAVPTGSTLENLNRLDILIHTYQPNSIVFLGDLLHAKESHSAEMLEALSRWRMMHQDLELILVVGNHDKHAGALPNTLVIKRVQEPFRLGPWLLCHHPLNDLSEGFCLAGHEHPVYKLKSRTDSLRLRCFWLGDKIGVLPAFGEFTGGFEINGQPQIKAVYVIAHDRVLAVPLFAESHTA